jgi:hypothetical protein
MIALIAVFRIELNISSLIDCSEFWMISSVIASDRVVVKAECPHARPQHAPWSSCAAGTFGM